MRYFVGIDNGVSGQIGVISSEGKYWCISTPVKNQLDYQKAKNNINRLDIEKLSWFLNKTLKDKEAVHVMIERPMVNPKRWKASMSGIRCLEATLVVMEYLGLSYEFVDSKQWQKALLPSGIEKDDLKKASLDIGVRLFPEIQIKGAKDRDGILIAEFCRRTYK